MQAYVSDGDNNIESKPLVMSSIHEHEESDNSSEMVNKQPS